MGNEAESPRGRLHVGTSRAPLALFCVGLDSGAAEPARTRPVERSGALSLDPERAPEPDDDPLPLPADDSPPPRDTAPPLEPPPLGPDERGVACWPSSYAKLLAKPAPAKPARCSGANSRTPRSPALMDGDDTALADGELP